VTFVTVFRSGLYYLLAEYFFGFMPICFSEVLLDIFDVHNEVRFLNLPCSTMAWKLGY